MDTTALKKFAQSARRQLLEQVAARMEQVLRTDSIEIREKAQAVDELKKQIGAASKGAVIDRVAYTWFNRFCALRFMDVNHYTRIGVVSPVEGFTQPEVLGEAKQGVIDESFKLDQARVFALLNGQIPSSNPQQEAYRLLLKGACNAWHAEMPFLFPEIEDYTELLMPDDLLSENSVLQGVRETLTPKSCQDVEVIGWLYQYYISERKDEVFAGLKKGKKVEADDIPAATQLFTPHWIVRYLVENSLGRLWMLNHPDSKLAKGMDYYIRPEEEESDFLEIASPEEIKFCDPACGSGHILTYAFDLLYAIYEEQGYDPLTIPSLILKENIYGIEIDARAGNLAAFALTMKARAKDRRFFKRKVEPNLCVLENVRFTASEIDEYMDVVGRDLFTQDLWQLLRQFEQAENFGSLIRPALKDISFVRERLEEKGVFENLFLHDTNKRVKRVLEMAEYLSPCYHVVVANPPYMGNRGMNDDIRELAKVHYPDSKSDAFAMFIERGFTLVKSGGYNAMVTMESWMFLSSFENMRTKILNNYSIVSLAHMPYLGKGGTSMGISFGTSATIFYTNHHPNLLGLYTYIRYFETDEEGVPYQFPVKNKRLSVTSPRDFKKIPGSPIAYWVSNQFREAMQSKKIEDVTDFTGSQNKTANNELYLKYWHELSFRDLHKKWIVYSKGGSYRKYFGNLLWCVDWSNDARKFYSSNKTSNLLDQEFWFREAISYTATTSKAFSARFLPKGCVYDMKGPAFHPRENKFGLLALVNSKPVKFTLDVLSTTIDFQVKDIKVIPVPEEVNWDEINNIGEELYLTTKADWDNYENSFEFSISPIIPQEDTIKEIKHGYSSFQNQWREATKKMMAQQENVNKVMIPLFGLQGEITPEILLSDITLTANPYYRYDSKKNDEELEALLLADTMKEFISYAVGCMLGRYSLDKPGLILANAGETQEDYLRQVPEPTFMPDDDNVIPILAGEWFEDDIAERFKQFLKITFGTEHYEENLAFIEEAIGKDIRAYFVKDFYNNHVKMYKKRPIYWQFSSAKGSFNALIYMHRYRPDTVSVILNGYLRQYREKLRAHKSMLEARSISGGASQSEKTKALKEIEKLNKIQAELKEYEDEVLYPLATRQIEIDLDDGVKVNYPRFGAALKKVSGLS
jgi:hypothetical protein